MSESLKYILFFSNFQKCTLACMDPGRTLNVDALRPEGRLEVLCQVSFKDLSNIILLQFFVLRQFEASGRKNCFLFVSKS